MFDKILQVVYTSEVRFTACKPVGIFLLHFIIVSGGISDAYIIKMFCFIERLLCELKWANLKVFSIAVKMNHSKRIADPQIVLHSS